MFGISAFILQKTIAIKNAFPLQKFIYQALLEFSDYFLENNILNFKIFKHYLCCICILNKTYTRFYNLKTNVVVAVKLDSLATEIYCCDMATCVRFIPIFSHLVTVWLIGKKIPFVIGYSLIGGIFSQLVTVGGVRWENKDA